MGRIHKELTPPGVGIDSDEATKGAAEMSLIAHAALEGHLRQGFPRRQHQFLGSPYAPLHDIDSSRLSKGPAKDTVEMARAEMHDGRELSGLHPRVEFVGDLRSEAPGLPGRKPALQIRALCGPIPTQSQIDSQQCRGLVDAALCRSTVRVQCGGCGSQKTGQRIIAIGRC